MLKQMSSMLRQYESWWACKCVGIDNGREQVDDTFNLDDLDLDIEWGYPNAWDTWSPTD